MAYKFSFDLTSLSRSFFREVAKVSDQKNLHRKVGAMAERLITTFKIPEVTGLPLRDAVTLINDMIDIYARNLAQEESFKKSSRRALVLPHCSRKYMDHRCHADFDPELSSYTCRHCSDDCLINKAVRMGEKEGYDVYVLPGGSCIPKVLSKRPYDGVIGVACPNEIQMGVREYGGAVPYQAVPLLRNGCSNTEFNIDTLRKVLASGRRQAPVA